LQEEADEMRLSTIRSEESEKRVVKERALRDRAEGELRDVTTRVRNE